MTSSVLQRGSARGLTMLQTAVRKLPAKLRTPLAERFKPAFERAMVVVGRPELRAREQELRAAIAARPDDGGLWYELGLCLDSRHRHREAADALVRAAELGSALPVITQNLVSRPRIRARAGSDELVERMRAIARADPETAQTQLLVGAFLVDQGRLEAGREAVRLGYEMAEGTRPDPSIAAARPRPDFLIVGPPKTGTTTLYDLLAQHPQVVPTPRKELQFWSHRYGRTLDHYEAYFPALSPGFITGEASTNYLASPEAAAGIALHYPDAKIIVLHRDPVSRAYSEYQMRCRDQIEGRSFEQVIETELRRIGPTAPLSMEQVPAIRRYHLLGSCILPYLRMWVDAVGPEQLMVLETAELSNNRQQAVDSVHRFLGLRESSVAGREDRNVHGYEPIPEVVADRLRRWFAPHEESLAAFLAESSRIVGSGR